MVAYIHGVLIRTHMYTNSSKSIQTASGCSWGGTRLVMWRTFELDLNLVLMFFAGDTITQSRLSVHPRSELHVRSTHSHRAWGAKARNTTEERTHVVPSMRGMTAHQTSALGAVQYWIHTLRQSVASNQGPPAEASEAACNDLFWLCTCVYKHPMNRQLCLFSWHYCTRIATLNCPGRGTLLPARIWSMG